MKIIIKNTCVTSVTNGTMNLTNKTLRELLQMTELYFVTETGQMEMNFDALELITTKRFAGFVKDDIENGYKLLKIENNKYEVVITLKMVDLLLVHKFQKGDKTESYQYHTIGSLQEMISLLVGDNE